MKVIGRKVTIGPTTTTSLNLWNIQNKEGVNLKRKLLQIFPFAQRNNVVLSGQMLHSKKVCIYRFNPEPHFPLAVRSAGVYTLVPGSLIEPSQRKWFSEIFWSEKGVGEFELENQRVQVRNNEIFFLYPGEIHNIKPLTPSWKYHWFALDHPQSKQWLEAFGCTRRPIHSRNCPVELFKKLRTALEKCTMQGDREASHHAHAILLKLIEECPSTDVHVSWPEQCRQLIDEGYSDPQLNVEAIALKTGIHRTTLFRAFRGIYGMTPSHYLQSRRLHHAIELLIQSDTPIKEVALKVGLLDANYLARLLRKTTGQSPSSLRASHR